MVLLATEPALEFLFAGPANAVLALGRRRDTLQLKIVLVLGFFEYFSNLVKFFMPLALLLLNISFVVYCSFQQIVVALALLQSLVPTNCLPIFLV